MAGLWSGTCLLADFSYEQTSKVTGGAMAGMMKFAGAFSKQAREPMKTTVAVKGDRMAHISSMSVQIIDLAKETMTNIDFQKKTYSVLTFAQLTEAMNQMNSKIRDEQGNETTELTFKASVKETGQKRNVAGMDARQVILTMEMEGTDKKTGQKAVAMTMTSDMWLAPGVAGYDEVRDFYKRMAQKMSWAPSMGMMAPAGSQKGMAEMMKEMSKLDGVPVFQVINMGGAGMPPGQQGAAQQQSQQPQQQQQAEQQSSGGALGRLAGGKLGGFGGFGRKKKQDDQPAAEQSGSSQSAAAPQGAPGSLMEMTTELSAFSTSAVDASKFEVPAGFKQVESDMLKRR
jgi:hypothetical protein